MTSEEPKKSWLWFKILNNLWVLLILWSKNLNNLKNWWINYNRSIIKLMVKNSKFSRLKNNNMIRNNKSKVYNTSFSNKSPMILSLKSWASLILTLSSSLVWLPKDSIKFYFPRLKLITIKVYALVFSAWKNQNCLSFVDLVPSKIMCFKDLYNSDLTLEMLF